MPKERIYDQVGMYDLQVAWEPGGHVQVGVESHDGRSLAFHLTGENQTPADFKGVWGTFDREGINRAIRVLRRARDSAFGRDE
ncbi:hypothetical protein KBX50_05265 [Micromonospora sp. C51]|uniref:hypothetical protein n=1 Tax=Micromonospora sp. C51 TaxID=2824879 RepID=UPI001B39904E|nr:hypothetical protein [Micromonospora sp. C51]MBQ1047868.1 hypothetical protein [Micromonospora sp. C51]